MRVLGDIARLGAKRHPNKTAIIFGTAALTYRQMDDAANRFASRLAQQGVVAGDRVAWLAENCIEYPVVAFAVLKLGAILVPLNFRYSAKEVAYVVNDSTPCCLLVGAGYEALAAEAAAAFNHQVWTIELAAETVARTHDAEPCPPPGVEVDPSTAAMVMYTSGTTGFPKGVLFSHASFLAVITGFAGAGDLRAADRVQVALPLFHNGGLNGLLMPTLTFGATAIIMPKGFEPEAILASVAQHRVTVTMWVPTMLAMLINSGALARFDVSSLTKIWYGSSPITPTLLNQVRNAFRADLYQFYGMTETGLTAVLRPEDHVQWANCTGREVHNADLRIVDEDFRDVGVGEVGEIISRQVPLGMIGYINNEKATRETIVDGWIRTGDMARNEGEGLLTIVDRKNDMLISGAENIYPKEIENVIAEHPDVLEVAVFGIPDAVYGESVCAAVVPRPAAVLSEEALVSWCGKRLVSNKKPKRVLFLAELPKNAFGKVTKKVLKAPFWQGQERQI